MTTINIAELCRLCVNPSYYYVNVFNRHSLDGNRLFETLNATCQLNIVEGDDLPRYICMQCSSKVLEIEVFKQKSQKGRRKLLSLIKKTPSKEEYSELMECNITDTGGATRCSGAEEIEIEEHQAVLKIEQVEEPNEGEFWEEYGVEEESFIVEIDSPKKAIACALSSEEDSELKECNTRDTGGRTRYSGGEEIEIEEHPAVFKIEQVEEPNEVEFSEEFGEEEDSFKAAIESPNKAIARMCINSGRNCTEDEEIVTEESEVSSVPDCLTVSGEINTEAAWHNQEHRVVDALPVKGSFKMWNLERCEMPMFQKESNDKPNEESTVNPNRCCDNNEEDREECRTKEMNKGRLQNKMGNIIGNLAVQNCKPNVKDCRRVRTNNACQKKHLETKNPGDSVVCSDSNKATKVKNLIKKNVGEPVIITKGTNSLRNRSMSESQRYFCDTCKKGYRYKWYLVHHVRIHIGVRPYKCTICDKSFSWKKSLLRHNSAHTVVGKPHVCTECGKSFKHEYSLKLHNKLHRDYPFPCVTCGKFFKSVITFQEHQKIHGIVKSFPCKICSKCFVNKRTLQQHLETHEENRNKPFSCHICNKSFRTKTHLKNHMYTHDNLRIHKCSICAKLFSFKYALKRHIQTHSRERAFKCPNCGKCYNTMEYLKQHMTVFCKKM